ncbi:MAG: hypothetical protein JW928_02325, partial [Candidatus Aureabacteria bacterium]|nr:hypothetical protein [Candidatus Auribacterota bacterium]
KIMPFNISMTPILDKDKETIGTAFIGRDMRQMISILRQLKEINTTLEEKVKERTNELEEANQILKDAQSKLVLSEKMSAMSLLAGGISHEISNPIMAIIGFADMLMSSEDDEGNRLKLQKIKNFAFNCMDIINKFCDFAMKPGTEFEDISINQVIEDTLLLAKNKLKYDVDVIKDLQSDLPRIKGESNELQNVFINIILNAKDAMPEGGRLYVRTYLQNSRVFVSIRDTGKGIPQNLIEKIFEPFFTTKESRGTGLGLSVGQEIIKAHGGNIAVESEEGKGTSVIVCFPIPEKAEDRKQATEDRLK